MIDIFIFHFFNIENKNALFSFFPSKCGSPPLSGSCGNFIFNCLRNFQAVSQRNCIVLYSYPAVYEGSNFPISSPTLTISLLVAVVLVGLWFWFACSWWLITLSIFFMYVLPIYIYTHTHTHTYTYIYTFFGELSI